MDDFALLKAYADSGSDAAFRELVDRHVATVYSAARRQAGEAVAADVTQAVFVLLARKAAKLSANTILTAWLLTTTRLVCRATLRKETRRQHREKEAADMHSTLEPNEVQSAWEQVQPILDEALASLSEGDRSLVALRFFEKKSHGEIAAALGLSEDASKKRLSRAVERLRSFFGRRGVTVAAVVLAAAVAQNAVKAAPTGLAATIGATASSGVAGATTATLVHNTVKFVTAMKLKIAAISGAAVLLVAAVPVLLALADTDSNDVKQPDGRDVKLEQLNFRKTSVRYTYPLGAPRPNVVICRPNFPGEPLLSAFFSWQEGGKLAPVSAARVAVSDEHGNEYDPFSQHIIFGTDPVNGRQYFVHDSPIFPRRDKKIHVRLIGDGNLLTDFVVPNPAAGRYPNWTPQPLPVIQTNGNLEVSLNAFRSVHAEWKSRTECDFSFREQGQDTTAWQPCELEVSDATGNHWHPAMELGSHAGHVEILSALWAGESAWKIRGEFKRVAGFSESELLEISGIEIPGPDDIVEPHTSYDKNGATVDLAGVTGRRQTNAGLGMQHRNLVNVENRAGCVTVALAGQILSRNRRLVFVRASDDQGRPAELVMSGEPHTVEDTRDPILYSFVLRASPNAQALNLVIALTEPKFAEFVAKPEQVTDTATEAVR